MKDPESGKHTLIVLALLFAGGAVIGCAKSSSKEAAQPAVEAAPADQTSDAALAPSPSVGPSTPAASPARKKAQPGLESLDKGADGELAPAEEEAPANLPGEQVEATDSLKALHAQVDAFDVFLAPGELSCGGARPHLDAICAIAERLCGAGPDTLNSDKDCQAATQSCQSAKKRYQEKCA